MATFKAVVRSARRDGFMTVYIRVTHQRCHGYIKTDKMLTRRELSPKGEIKDIHVLGFCTERILEFNTRLNNVDIAAWPVSRVVEYLQQADENLCFSDYARLHIRRLMNNNQDRTAKNYRLALSSLERFMGTNRVLFADLSSNTLNRWIKSIDHTKRSKEQYPVCMRQVFRAADLEFNDLEAGIVRIKSNPWRKVRIPQADRPTKLAIKPADCRAFFACELPQGKYRQSLAEFGRDVAKLVLCLGGINAIDLFNLQKSDLREGVICYCRAKTKKARADDAYFEMRLEDEIRPLLEKYAAPPGDPYLLDFHRRYASSDSFGTAANAGIVQVCRQLNVAKPYCVYAFRHTWATVAQNNCGATLEQVAFGMNHSNGHAVTRGYVKLDFTPAWELNRKVVDFIFRSTSTDSTGTARSLDEPKGDLFRLSPKMMVYARAYFRGDVVAELCDIGFGTVGAVISALAAQLPTTVPEGCAVQFRIRNCDTGREAVYERTRGCGI